MKCLIFVVAIVALVSAAEEKKPEEKKDDKDRRGLLWPMPEPLSEGDLMLHGAIAFDRVRALHKAKLDDEVDKMILNHGRIFLRRVSKYFEDNVDFKIMPILCRDSVKLNGTNNRWRIEIPKAAPVDPKDAPKDIQKDSPIPKDKEEKVAAADAPRSNITAENETTTAAPLSSSSAKPDDKASTTGRPPVEAVDERTYEVRRHEFYRLVGSNFARLLMREYRKETLIVEETEYLARWINDEAVHYGAFAIYCAEGEDVKAINKKLATYLEEKP